jgi:hypothetical protein
MTAVSAVHSTKEMLIHALRVGDLHSRETGSHSGRREDHHQQDHEGDRLHLVRALLLGRVVFGLGVACTSEGV